MNIFLFDPHSSGHHVKYASQMVRYFKGKGDTVTMATWRADESLGDLGVPVESLVNAFARPFGTNVFSDLFSHILAFRHCLKKAEEHGVDIVHHLSLNRNELALFLGLSAGSPPCKVYGTFWQPYFIPYTGERWSLPRRLYYWINRWSLGRLLKGDKLSGLFVHSQRIKEVLIAHYGKQVTNYIHVVPDPIEPMDSIPPDDARKRLGIPIGVTVFLFFGKLRRQKGPHVLFQALSRLDGDWRVVVAGSAGEMERQEAVSCKKALPDPEKLITHFGFIPDEEMATYFSAADAVALPYTRGFKGTSGILQTAASAGKPVIASDVGDVGPAVKEYGLGILVEPESPEALAQGMSEFIKNKDRVAEDVKPGAKKYSLAHDWRVMAKKVRQAYIRDGD